MRQAIFAAVVFAALALNTAPSPAQGSNSAKHKAIVEMMEITGAQKMLPKMADQAMSGMIQIMRQANPKLDERAVAIVRDEVAKAMNEQAPAMLAAIAASTTNIFPKRKSGTSPPFTRPKPARRPFI